MARLRGKLGANKGAHAPDSVTSRTASRYVWTRLEHVDGAMLELTLWADGRWSLQGRGDDHSGTREILGGKVGDISA